VLTCEWADKTKTLCTNPACLKIYWGKPLGEVLALEKNSPDFQYSRPEPDSELAWIHRHYGNTDIYFVANQKERSEDIQATFRVEGREVELWHPDTGKIEPSEYKIEMGHTTVPLRFDPYGSVFVVFRKTVNAPERRLPHPKITELATISGPWQVRFPPNWGAPSQIELDQLISWTANPEDGVKYFSGTATYTKDVSIPERSFAPSAKLLLDLGRVREIAEVSVNGKPAGGILWKPPFQADVTSVLKPGTNRVEIKITNLWPNRIIGDRQPTATKQYAWLDYRPFRADTPLFESGLLGPVKLLAVTASD
jgi:alpha-L-rhamnosidase